jgi:hypothetical protein
VAGRASQVNGKKCSKIKDVTLGSQRASFNVFSLFFPLVVVDVWFCLVILSLLLLPLLFSLHWRNSSSLLFENHNVVFWRFVATEPNAHAHTQ